MGLWLRAKALHIRSGMGGAIVAPSSFAARCISSLPEIAFALILLVSTALNAQNLLGPSRYGTRENPPHAMFLWVAIFLEWLLAVWLLTGLAAQWARRASVALLTLFIAIAATRLLMGSSDCECFGRFSVNPVWTIALDLTLLSAFYFVRVNSRTSARQSAVRRDSTSWRRILSTCVISLTLPAATMHAATNQASSFLTRSVVILEPEMWVGRPLPLLQSLDGPQRDDLESGSFRLLIIDHDCAICLHHLDQQSLTKISNLPDNNNQENQVAVIDISPNSGGNVDLHLRARVKLLRLSPESFYLAKVPYEITLKNGVVERVGRPG